MALSVISIFLLGSSSTTCSKDNHSLTNKYCGSYLGYGLAAKGNQLICGKQNPTIYFMFPTLQLLDAFRKISTSNYCELVDIGYQKSFITL